MNLYSKITYKTFGLNFLLCDYYLNQISSHEFPTLRPTKNNHRKFKEIVNGTKPTVKEHPNTAATIYFITPECAGKGLPHKPINFACDNQAEITSTKIKELKMCYHKTKKEGHMFKYMKKNLVLVPLFCDAGLLYQFCKHKVQIIKNNNKILEGNRDKKTRLWSNINNNKNIQLKI